MHDFSIPSNNCFDIISINKYQELNCWLFYTIFCRKPCVTSRHTSISLAVCSVRVPFSDRLDWDGVDQGEIATTGENIVFIVKRKMCYLFFFNFTIVYHVITELISYMRYIFSSYSSKTALKVIATVGTLTVGCSSVMTSIYIGNKFSFAIDCGKLWSIHM